MTYPAQGKLSIFEGNRSCERAAVRVPTIVARVGLVVLIGLPSLAAVQHATAGGASESRLEQAERLIAAKDYNQAILLLSALVDEKPEFLDQAQALLTEVFEIKREYRDTLDQLVETLTVAEDPASALQLIDRLQEIDPNPNDEVTAQLAEARDRVAVLFLREALAATMDAAAAELAAGNPVGAIGHYVTGYTLFRDEFDGSQYGNLVAASVDSSTDRLLGASSQITAVEEAVAVEAAEIRAQVASGQQPSIDDARRVLLPSADGAIRAVAASQTLTDLNAQLREGGQIASNDSFLVGAGIITLGRPDRKPEGLAYAIETLWESYLASVLEPLTTPGAALLGIGVSSYRAANYAAAIDTLQQADRLYAPALDLSALRGIGVGDASSFGQPWAVASSRRLLPDQLTLQAGAREAEAYQVLARAQLSSAVAGGALTSREDVDQAVSRLLQELRGADAHAARWRDALASYRALTDLPPVATTLVPTAQLVIEQLETVVAAGGTTATAFALPLVEEEVGAVAAALQRLRSRVETAAEQLEGLPGVTPDVPPRRFPDAAITALAAAIADAEDTMTQAAGVGVVWGAAAFAGAQTPALIAALDLAARTESDAEQLRIDADGLLTEAEEFAFQALRFRREGERLVERAEQEIGRRAFAAARDSIRDATDALLESLAFQEDNEVRVLLDERLSALAAQMNDAENRAVVVQVRELINQGRDLYNQAQFTEAAGVLVSAQDRWSDTNSDENPEINNWLNIVRSALAVRSGRELLPDDPLFTPMTQNLSFAVQNFDSGISLIEANRSRDAIDAFTRAESFLDRIRLTFPYNSEARVLSLRITQVTDPEGFASRLGSLFREAIALDDQQEAYAQLKTIEELQPGYPGLANAILELEYALQIRVRPPDPALLARSNQLLEEATGIRDRGDRAAFDTALARLNEALRLNPNNADAVALKDELQTFTGGGVRTVLSSDALELFHRAEQLFVDRRFLEARRITQQLLRDGRNAGYRPLLDLEERIDRNL